MASKDLHAGHRDRLRDRFIRDGLSTFEPHNVLELMLFYGIPYKDTNELAHALIARFGSFDKVLEAGYDELVTVPGVGKNAASLIMLFNQVNRYYDMLKADPGMKFNNSDSIVEYAKPRYKHLDVEMFSIMCLDSECHLLKFAEISRGIANMTDVNIRKAVEVAVRAKAVSVVAMHNHPSNSLKVSAADINTTRMLKDALNLLSINLVDHIIITNLYHLSMLDTGAYNSILNVD